MIHRLVRTCARPTLALATLLSLICLSAPMVQASNHALYVSSGSTDNVKRYNDVTGAFIDTFASTAPVSGGLLNQPRDIAFGTDGNVYVVSELTNQVKRYNGTTGAFIGNFVTANLSNPVGLAFGPADGNLYVASFKSDNVQRFNGTTGAPIGTFASGNGLDGPYDLTFGPGGDLFVISSISGHIKRFDGTTGAFEGNFVSGLTSPSDLTFGPDGRLYVINRGPNQVIRYDGTTGAFIDIFASRADWHEEAIGLGFGPDGNLYVGINQEIGDNGQIVSPNGRIERFNGMTGLFMDVFVSSGSGGLQGTTEFAFRPGAGGPQTTPILPSNPTIDDGRWSFPFVTGIGRWFDPTPAESFLFSTTDGSHFTQLQLPSGLGDADGLYSIDDAINGQITLPEGGSYTFPTPVSSFKISGIQPAVDADSPSAFPTYLVFDQPVVSFTMTPAIVPEPSAFALATMGAIGLGFFFRKSRWASRARSA